MSAALIIQILEAVVTYAPEAAQAIMALVDKIKAKGELTQADADALTARLAARSAQIQSA